jgi:hypothetical protein
VTASWRALLDEQSNVEDAGPGTAEEALLNTHACMRLSDAIALPANAMAPQASCKPAARRSRRRGHLTCPKVRELEAPARHVCGRALPSGAAAVLLSRVRHYMGGHHAADVGMMGREYWPRQAQALGVLEGLLECSMRGRGGVACVHWPQGGDAVGSGGGLQGRLERGLGHLHLRRALLHQPEERLRSFDRNCSASSSEGDRTDSRTCAAVRSTP